MENLWLDAKARIANALGASINEIEEPDKFGDFAYACFSKAKQAGKNPKELAAELASGMKIDLISRIEVTGPYLNFYVDWNAFSRQLLEGIDSNYGSWNEKETVMMDVFQANPFKAFHIGHIKNAATGESVRRILEKTGRKTVTVNYNGDVGIHVARWLLYYTRFCNNEKPKDFTRFCGEVYAKSAQMAKDDAKFEEEAQEFNRKLDQRDPAITNLWKELRDLWYEDIERVRNEMDVKVEFMIPESECEVPGKETVMRFFKEGKLKESDGAIGIDLGNGLGFFILLKSDGTAIYATKDIGLLQRKKEKANFDRMVYVVGSEQNLYFQQLFKTFDILGLYPLDRSKHVSHGLVTLKEGKMASRLGNVISYEDLRDMMVKKVLEEMETKNPDADDMEETARKIALGAIMFQMLDVENNKLIRFDWEQALDIQGRSGPYLQYSLVRALNIIRKERAGNYDASLLKDGMEMNLIKKIAKYPGIVKNAAENYAPNIIANYIFEMAQEFNSFYQNIQVLKAEEEMKKARLKLVEAFATVLESGMYLLNIPRVEKM